MPRHSFLLLAACAFAGCAQPRDPLESVALQSSYEGTRAGLGRGGRDTVGLEAGAKVVERYYWVAKYEATREQRQSAQSTAKRVAPKIIDKARKQGRKAPRYLAIRTKSDQRAKTSTSVMIWDTQSQQIVGNDVYDLNETPPPQAAVKFETYSAQYVGSQN